MSLIIIFLILALLTGGLSFGGFVTAAAFVGIVRILFFVCLLALAGSVIMHLLA